MGDRMTVPGGAGIAARALVGQICALSLGDEWNVYPYVPDSVAAPAAAVVPRSPYREISTHCIERVHLSVVILVGRGSDPVVILDQLDAKLDDLRDDLQQDPRIVVDSVAALGQTMNVGATDYLTARLDVDVHMN